MEPHVRQLLLHAVALVSAIVFLLIFGKKITKYIGDSWNSLRRWFVDWNRLRYSRQLNRREEKMFGRDRKVDGIRRVSSNIKKKKYRKHSHHRSSSRKSEEKSQRQKF